MTIEHSKQTEDGDVLIRVTPEIHAKVAKALGYNAADENIPGGWEHGLFPSAIDAVAAKNPNPQGPAMMVHDTLVGRMRQALGKPLGDDTPVHELVQQIIEKLTGTKTKLKAASAADEAALAASATGTPMVLALTATAPRRDGQPDRQLELMRQMTARRAAPAKVLVLSADALALSGDRQSQLLREQLGAEAGADDRQMQLLNKQLAGQV